MSTTAKPTRKEQDRSIRQILLADPMRSDRRIAEIVGASNKTVSSIRNRMIAAGELLPRPETTQPSAPSLARVCTSVIRPARLNDVLYDPVDEDDPQFLRLVENIQERGILDPIVVAGDGVILSGHRRYAAACRLGLDRVPVLVRHEVSSRNSEEFLKLLASYNCQRVKTTAEQVREQVAVASDDPSYRVRRFRYEASALAGVDALAIRERRRRSKIRNKTELADAIIKTVEEERANWPLSDRRMHYLLLNLAGLVRNDVSRAPYVNDLASYKDCCDMLTRLRISGLVPFDAFADETRGVTIWKVHRSVSDFAHVQIDKFLSGYYRNLLQSQPNWVELLVEKNTVSSLLEGVSAKYAMPMTSGRGYSSLPPRKEMVDRFNASGREKLVVIVVADHDPEGEDIPESFGASLRDDFGIPPDKLVIVKAALTHEQVQALDLHEGQVVKGLDKSSDKQGSRLKRYRQRYGDRCWELESVPADTLRRIVEQSIRSVLDVTAFERELAQEEQEQRELVEHRQRARQALLQAQIGGKE